MTNKRNKTESLRSRLDVLKSVRLSEQDQASMKSRLLSYADTHAAPERTAHTLSPFTYTSLLISSRIMFSTALVLILLVGTTGVTLAAENTLPGQPLYAIKVNVAEPVESALISVTAGKAGEARWQNRLAERRLQEASQLAAKNELASSTQDFLAQQVAEHVSASQQESAALAEAGATTTAVETNSDLTARLSAHAQILALLTDRLESYENASTTVQIAALVTKARKVQATLTEAASTTELAIASETPDSASTSTPMLAMRAGTAARIHVEEAHILRAELRVLNYLPKATTTASSTATSTASTTETASTTATTSDKTATTSLKAKILELLKN